MRKPDPGGLGNACRVVNSEKAADNGPYDDACYGRPKSKHAGALEGDGGDDKYGYKRAEGGSLGMRGALNVVQEIENYRHHGDGNQHDYRACDRGGEYPAKQGKTFCQGKLKQRRDNDERRQHGGSALCDRGNADCDECAGGAHQEDISCAETTNSDGLQYRADPADHD